MFLEVKQAHLIIIHIQTAYNISFKCTLRFKWKQSEFQNWVLFCRYCLILAKDEGEETGTLTTISMVLRKKGQSAFFYIALNS